MFPIYHVSTALLLVCEAQKSIFSLHVKECGPLSQLPRAALTCGSGPGMWVELGPQVMVLGCGSTSVLCLALSLPHYMSWGQSNSSPGSPRLLGQEGVRPLLGGPVLPRHQLGVGSSYPCVSGGWSWFVFCDCAKALPKQELGGKGLVCLKLAPQPMAKGGQGRS